MVVGGQQKAPCRRGLCEADAGLQRGDLGLLGFQLGQLETVIFQLLALLGDDSFRRLGDEGFVAELAFDAAALADQTGNLFGQTGQFGILVDETGHRDHQLGSADQLLH